MLKQNQEDEEKERKGGKREKTSNARNRLVGLGLELGAGRARDGAGDTRGMVEELISCIDDRVAILGGSERGREGGRGGRRKFDQSRSAVVRSVDGEGQQGTAEETNRRNESRWKH